MLSDSFSKQGSNYIDTQDSVSSQNIVRRKPGRPPKQHPPGTINGIIAECAVCHDKATGLHYAVMTCEGCKGFFKRSIQAEKQYKCRAKGDCIINKDSRNACQACRMKCCYDVGMKEILVRDDRTPGNRKKRVPEGQAVTPIVSSDNSDNAADAGHSECFKTIKVESIYSDPIGHVFKSNQCYMPIKKDYFNHDSNMNISTFNHNNGHYPGNPLDHEILYSSGTQQHDYEDWDLSLMSPESMHNDTNNNNNHNSDCNTTDAIQHITSMYNQSMTVVNNSQPICINCSGDQEMPQIKCRHSPKCLMHLLTRLIKAKPLEPAFCKYFGRFPTSEQFLDCLADEIHLIIRFAKKTPGFCELSMSRKLSLVQKHVLSILFVRIIYRSLSCPPNHIQFASNLCLNYNDCERIEILSARFRQALMELISSFKSLNLDMYELCLIQYAIIEEDNWNPEIPYYPMLDGFEKSADNNSQTYFKLYTTNKYPEQPHRWIFIMLSLTQVQEMVKTFTSHCLDLVRGHRIVISNDILKEILSI